MVDNADDEEEASTYEARPWSTVSVLLSLTSDSFPDLAPLPALANLLSPLDCPLSLSLSSWFSCAVSGIPSHVVSACPLPRRLLRRRARRLSACYPLYGTEQLPSRTT